MGYSCPVCGDPQADGVHLANHLAFTAMIRGGDHEAWLDEHVPEWIELGESELAAELTSEAAEAKYPQVFEDTTPDHSHSHGDGHEHGHSHSHSDGHEHESEHNRGHAASNSSENTLPPGTTVPEPSLGEDATEVLEEAQELTRKRRENATEEGTETATDDDSETE